MYRSTSRKDRSKEGNTAIITSPTPHTAIPSFEGTSKSVVTLGDDEELVDFEPTLFREGMDINMVYYLPAESHGFPLAVEEGDDDE